MKKNTIIFIIILLTACKEIDPQKQTDFLGEQDIKQEDFASDFIIETDISDLSSMLDMSIKYDMSYDMQDMRKVDEDMDLKVEIKGGYEHRCISTFETTKDPEFNYEPVPSIEIDNEKSFIISNPCGLSNLVNENRGIYSIAYNDKIDSIFAYVSNYNAATRLFYGHYYMNYNLEQKVLNCESPNIATQEDYRPASNFLFVDRNTINILSKSGRYINSIFWSEKSWNKNIEIAHNKPNIYFSPMNPNRIQNIVLNNDLIVSNYGNFLVAIDAKNGTVNWLKNLNSVLGKNKIDLNKDFILAEENGLNIRYLNKIDNVIDFLKIDQCGEIGSVSDEVKAAMQTKTCGEYYCIYKKDDFLLSNIDVFDSENNFTKNYQCNDFLKVDTQIYACISESQDLKKTLISIIDLNNEFINNLEVNVVGDQLLSKSYHTSIATKNKVFIIKEDKFYRNKTTIELMFFNQKGEIIKTHETIFNAEDISIQQRSRDMLITKQGFIAFDVGKNIHLIKTNLSF